MKTKCEVHGTECGQVSVGFYKLFKNFQTDVERAVVDYLTQNSWSQVYVGGHSLGAAVATLMTVDLAAMTKANGGPIQRIHMAVFGSPRVGDRDWVFAARRFMNDTTAVPFVSGTRSTLHNPAKVVTLTDPITELPATLMKYFHIIDMTSIHCECVRRLRVFVLLSPFFFAR